MKIKSILALLSLLVIGFSAHAYNRDESLNATPAIVSLDCISQLDNETAIINPKCLAKENVATIQIFPASNCSHCARLTNVAESSACYNQCYGGR